MGISEDGQAAADAKALEVQTMFIKAGGIGNGRYPMSLASELLAIHKACIDRAMTFVAQFAHTSNLPLIDLCNSASGCLTRRVVVFVAPVLRAMKISSSPANEGVVASTRAPFEKQIDDAIENLKVGFVSGRSVSMSVAETVQAKALKLLRTVYETTRATEQPIFVESLKEELGLSTADVHAAWRYLADKGLIDKFSIPYTARINARGVDAIEAAIVNPDKTTAVFPSVTYNITINGTGAGSQVNMMSPGSQQISTVSTADPEAVRKLVEGVDQLLNQVQRALPTSTLSAEIQAQVETAVLELRQAATEEKPEPTRLRRGLESMGRILEHAAGDLLAVGARVAIQQLLGIPLS
jgi:hypothetical protein